MQKKTSKFIFIFIFFFIFVMQLVLAKPQKAPKKSIQAKINELIEQYAPNANIGIVIKSLDKNKIVYQKKPDLLFTPASIMKNLTAISALSYLGPNYFFETEILANDPVIKDGVLKHDMYLKFTGDPSLTHEHVKDLIRQLSSTGVQSISGDFYIDDSIFDHAYIGSGWMWEDLNFCYASPISPILIDKNCLTVKVTPGERDGEPTSFVTLKDHVTITNNVITRNPARVGGNCKINLSASDDNSYLLSGCLKTNSKPIGISIAVRNIRSYAKDLILTELQNNSIYLQGMIKFKKMPQNDDAIYVFARHRSAPLSELIRTMLKESDNTIADALYKKIGCAYFSKPAGWRDGFKAVKLILESQGGVAFDKMKMDDGSGLSHHNLITPNVMIHALTGVYRNKSLRKYFVDALPYAGVDGTLEHRMRNLKNRVYAKTGNMGNVSSLAGFIDGKNKEKFAFVIIINSFLGNPKKMHKLQDKICSVVANGD